MSSYERESPSNMCRKFGWNLKFVPLSKHFDYSNLIEIMTWTMNRNSAVRTNSSMVLLDNVVHWPDVYDKSYCVSVRQQELTIALHFPVNWIYKEYIHPDSDCENIIPVAELCARDVSVYSSTASHLKGILY